MIFKEIYYNQMKNSNIKDYNDTFYNNPLENYKNDKMSFTTNMNYSEIFNNFTKTKIILDDKIYKTKLNEKEKKNNNNGIIYNNINIIEDTSKEKDIYTESDKEKDKSIKKIFLRKSLFTFKIGELIKKDIEDIPNFKDLYLSPKIINKLKKDLDFKSKIIDEYLINIRYY
jgi:hypothetical protein